MNYLFIINFFIYYLLIFPFIQMDINNSLLNNFTKHFKQKWMSKNVGYIL